MSFGLKRDVLRRGEYRNYTFRLPTHVPNLTLSVVADYGCVCLYASNCSERPLPRQCQWTLLVDAEKQKQGQLNLKTSEHHFVSGLYHVGLYCVADASFSLGCFTAEPSEMIRAAVAAEKRQQAANGMTATLGLMSHRKAAPLFPSPRATKKPFIDAGLLEVTLDQRARQPRGEAIPGTTTSSAALAASSPRGACDARDARPGDAHDDHLLGEWHRTLRDAIRNRTGPQGGEAARNGLAPPGALGSLPRIDDKPGGAASPRIKPKAAAMPTRQLPQKVPPTLAPPSNLQLAPGWLGM